MKGHPELHSRRMASVFLSPRLPVHIPTNNLLLFYYYFTLFTDNYIEICKEILKTILYGQ